MGHIVTQFPIPERGGDCEKNYFSDLPCSVAAIKSGSLQEETANFIYVNITQVFSISTFCCCLPNREREFGVVWRAGTQETEETEQVKAKS